TPPSGPPASPWAPSAPSSRATGRWNGSTWFATPAMSTRPTSTCSKSASRSEPRAGEPRRGVMEQPRPAAWGGGRGRFLGGALKGRDKGEPIAPFQGSPELGCTAHPGRRPGLSHPAPSGLPDRCDLEGADLRGEKRRRNGDGRS